MWKNFHFRSFIYHWYYSRSKYDIHSPFVYKLYVGVLKDNSDHEEYRLLKEEPSLGKVMVPVKYARLLVRLAKHFHPGKILISGVGKEPKFPALFHIPESCRVFYEDSDPGILNESGTFDMIIIFLDTEHIYSPEYFSGIMQHIHNDSVLIFYNIHGSREIAEAWKKIIHHPSVTVSIDLFYLGLVFCKEELTREEFMICL